MKKILVIDDEEWLREMIRLALRQKGFAVIEAENGAVGIEKAREGLPDLILCDVNMDKVDGYLTLSSLRNEPGTAAIINVIDMIKAALILRSNIPPFKYSVKGEKIVNRMKMRTPAF